MKRAQQVLGIIYRISNNQKEFLLLHRIPTKGAFWQPPGGGVEEGESLQEALYREIFEETSITKENILAITKKVHEFIIDKHYITDKPITPITEYIFGVEVKPGVRISFDNNVYPEHNNFQWASYDKALQLLKWQNNKDGFEKLMQHLNKE